MSKATELADIIALSGVTPGSVLDEASTELRRLDRINAELQAQNEAQKNEWLSWEAKRRNLERDAENWRWWMSDCPKNINAFLEGIEDGWTVEQWSQWAEKLRASTTQDSGDKP